MTAFRLMPKPLMFLIAAAALAAAGEAERPLARWGFEHGTAPWRSPDSRISWSKRKAADGGWSLRIDAGFPHPTSIVRPAHVALDLASRIVYHAYVPADAPASIKTVLFLKDKDGLWFQHLREEPLIPGQWNRVAVDVSRQSPLLRPSGHHGLWTPVAARKMSLVGIKFFCDDAYSGPLYLDAVTAWSAREETPPLRVLNLRESAFEVGRYEKLELAFDLSRAVTNPFDPAQIRIDATFVGPDGQPVVVPAFHYQGYVRRLVSDREELVPVGAGCWKVRFAPVAEGPHSYFLTVQHGDDRLVTGRRTFACVASPSRGFIRVSKRDPRYFAFDDGTWFYPIGHNVHSPNDDTPRAAKIQQGLGAGVLPDRGTYSYDYLFETMAAHGENFAEIWMCTWWLALEWVADWRHYRGLTDYNLEHAWKLDYLVDLAARHGLYLHLVIDNHGKASTWCDPEWEDSPYNVVNGGFLHSPEDFFRNPVAREIYKKKLRYIIARWGYSTRIAGIELWSEVDLVGDSWEFHNDPAAAAPKVDWHRDIAAYLDGIDPWGHLVTTHFSTTWQRIQESLVSLPGIDYVVCDAYKLDGGGILPLVFGSARAFNRFGKPGMITEYGGSPLGSSPEGLRADFHAGIWASYMTHTAGTPLLWWFQFIESEGLYDELQALAAYHRGEDRLGQGLTPRLVTFPKPHHDVSAVALQSRSAAYVWVYSRRCMELMPRRGLAPTFDGLVLRLRGLTPADYRVEVWDTLEGRIAQVSLLAANGGHLDVPLPSFRTDCALKVKPVRARASRSE